MGVAQQFAILIKILEIGLQDGSERPCRQSEEQKTNQEYAGRSVEEWRCRFIKMPGGIARPAVGENLAGKMCSHLIAMRRA